MQAIGVSQQPELIYDENNNPICTQYKNKKDHIVKHRPKKDQEEIVFEEPIKIVSIDMSEVCEHYPNGCEFCDYNCSGWCSLYYVDVQEEEES